MSPEYNKPEYADAMEDFHAARRQAVLGEVLSRITGKTSKMIPYDEIRKRFGGIESASRQLKEIPLNAIVGTVSRFDDFNRKLLPLKVSDAERWASVRRAVENMTGLPPIEVYKVGEVYFILDGHHRASVARELGQTHIQAYVREVYTRVSLSPEDQPEDVILKAEYAGFLKQTKLDDLRPDADLRVTAPGEYDKLLEHISVHRYFQGIDEKRAVPYEDAVLDWYNRVYIPVANIIRNRNVLSDFPGRTEADLYLWIMEHRAVIENELGWKVSPTNAANDLASQYSPTIDNLVRRISNRILHMITPDQLEPSPPPGSWRKKHNLDDTASEGIFNTVMVAVTGDDSGWTAVDQAIYIAKHENASLGGLHISSTSNKDGGSEKYIEDLFQNKCNQAGIQGALACEQGKITARLYERSYWADLVALRLSYPPPFFSFRRFGSGLRNLIRMCKTPMIVVPPTARVGFSRLLLAYGGGPRADEALYLAAYMAARWKINLVVVTARRGKVRAEDLAARARVYLQKQNITNATIIQDARPPAIAILKNCETYQCDLILMGGYEGGYIREMIFGSTVDRVLWDTRCSVMISH